MWYFGHKRRPLSWPVSPGFFVKVLHWKSGGLMKLSRVNHLNLPSLEVKDPKYQQKKTLVQVPKYFKNPDSVSRHERKKKLRILPHLSAMVFWSAPLPLLRPLHFYSSSVGASQGTVRWKTGSQKNRCKKVTFSHGFLITQNGVQVMLFPCATVSWLALQCWIFRLRLGVCPNRSWWMHVLLHWWHHRAMVHVCLLS